MSDELYTMTRRQFTALSLAAGAGIAGAAAPGLAAASAPATALRVIDEDVQVPAADGACDAALVHPRGRDRWPGVILFVDAFGLRPAMRDMARRLASHGFAVLIPNPYYRSTSAPGIEPGFDFTNLAHRARLEALRAPLTRDALARDAAAYVAFLDGQAGVDTQARIGVMGYCMGGAMTLQAAAAMPHRIGAGASFHGGGLVTDKPDSPHRLVPAIRAKFYIGIAANDDRRQPGAKTALEAAFRAQGLSATIEVYPGTVHGWCVRDMPLEYGKPIYDEAAAERAWGELMALYTGVRA